MTTSAAYPTLRASTLIVALVLVLTVPFAGKALHIDDPLFVWMARHTAAHPFDPYGINVNWEGTTEPMFRANQNPPGVAYWLAVTGRAVGWNEAGLHASMIVFAIAAALGVYALARPWCRAPLTAALISSIAPGFLVSATTLMSDVPMLALYIWSLALWTQGVERESHGRLFAAAVLIGAAALMKYFAITAIPLALIYLIAQSPRRRTAYMHLVVPVLMIAAYIGWGYWKYDLNLLTFAAEYATDARWRDEPLSRHILIGLAFTGACSAPVAFAAPLMWKPRSLAIGAAGTLMFVGIFASARVFESIFGPHSYNTLAYRLQAGLWSAAGIHALTLTAAETWRKRDPAAWVLAAWIAGTFVFSVFVNHMINVRTVLPMLPPLGILAARRIEATHANLRGVAGLGVPLAASALLSLWVNWADYDYAGASRDAALRFATERAKFSEHVYVTHHWGFQYYMLAAGALPVEDKPSANPTLRPIQPGDTLAIPHANAMSQLPDPTINPMSARYVFPMRRHMTTMRGGAGFYSHYWGAIPFAIGPAPDEDFAFYKIGNG